MVTALKKGTNKGKDTKLNEEQQMLLDEYWSVMEQMRANRMVFQNTTDHELISACVYEMNAIQKRYSYLLSRLKEENITSFNILR